MIANVCRLENKAALGKLILWKYHVVQQISQKAAFLMDWARKNTY